MCEAYCGGYAKGAAMKQEFFERYISSQSFKSIQNHVFFEDKRTSAHFDDKEAKRTMSRRERKGELP